jgi:hypothetical protein
VRGDGIVAVAPSVEGAAMALLDAIVGDAAELVTVVTGADADATVTGRSSGGSATTDGERQRRRRLGPHGRGVLQPAVAGAQLRARHHGGPVRQGRRPTAALQMTSPIVDLSATHRARRADLPAEREGRLTTWEIAGWIEEALAKCAPRGIADPVPEAVLDRLDSSRHALRGIHEPESMAKEAARKRLAFDELLRVQLLLVLRKRALEREAPSASPTRSGRAGRALPRPLPFPLTGAQRG